MAGLFFDSGIDKGFEEDLKRMNTKMNAFSKNVVKRNSLVDDSFAQVKNQITGVVSVLAIGAAGKELLNFTKDLETALIEVSTISQAVTNDFSGYKDQLIALSTEGGQSVVDLTNAFYDLVSAGFDAEAGITLLAQAQQASTAGFVETKVAADGLTTVMNAWGKEATEAGKVSDIFFKTVEKGKTTFPELASNIAQVAPIAASLGVSFEEVAGAAATLTKSGTPTAQAFTQIRASLIATNEVLGDGWAEALTYQEALAKVSEKAGGSTNALTKMVGRIEAVNAVLGLTGNNATTAAEDLAAMEDALGSTATAAEKVTATTDQQIKILKNNILAALEPLGEEASNTLAKLAKNLNDAFQSGDIKKYAKIALELGKAFVAYKVSVIALNQIDRVRKNIILSNIKAMRIYSITGKQVTGANVAMANAAKGLKTAFAANPIGLLVAGLTLAIPLIRDFAEGLKEVDEQAKILAEVSSETAGNLDKETAALKVRQAQLQRTEANSEERVRLIEALNKEYPDLLSNIDGESASITQLNGVFNDYIKNLEKTIRLKVLQNKFEGLVNEQIEIRNNKDLTANEAFKALQAVEARRDALQEEIIYQKNIVDVNERYAELIKEQTQLLSEINEGGELKKQLVGQLQTYEEFVENYKKINSTLPDGTFISREFSKEELDKAYLEEVSRQRALVESTELTANRLRQIERDIKEELEGVVNIATRRREKESDSKIDPLKQLEIEHQLRINELVSQYATEEELQKEFNKKLLDNELIYLQRKRKLTTDALKKAKIDEQILSVKIEVVDTRKEEEKERKALLERYQTFLDKRTSIQKKYEKDIEKLSKQGYDAQAREAKKAQEKELKDLDSRFAKNNEEYKEWFQEELPAITKKGIEALKEELKNVQFAINVADQANTEEAIKKLAIYSEKIKEINGKLKNLTTGGAGGISDSGSAIKEISDVSSEAFRNLGEGITQSLAELSTSFIDAFDKFSSDSASASQKASGLVSLILQVGNVVNEAIADSYDEEAKRLDRVNQGVSARISAEQTLNEIIREREALERGYSAFIGANYKNEYSAALDTIRTSSETSEKALAQLRKGLVLTAEGSGESFFGLNKTTEEFSYTIDQILAGINKDSRKFWGNVANIFDPIDLFGGAATAEASIDAYDKVKDAFNSALESMGKTAGDMAQFSSEEWTDFYTILDEGGFIAEQGTKQLVNTLRESQEQYTAALEQMRDIIQDIAGDLGDSLTDALVTSIQEGTDALDIFADSVNNVLTQMVKTEVNELFFRRLFDNLQMEMERSMAGGDQDWEDDILRFYDKLPDAIGGAEKFLRDFDERMKELGFEGIISLDDDKDKPEDRSIAGRIQDTITEETGGQLVGRLGAIMLTNDRIANNTEDSLDIAVQNLVTLNAIKTNTDYLPEIANNTRRTVEKLESI